MKAVNTGFHTLLALTAAIAISSVLISAALQYWGMIRLDRIAGDVHHGDAALAAAAESMRQDVLELRRYEKDMFMNVGSDTLVHDYRAKWDRAFVKFRYDLIQARRTGPTSQDAQLQQVTDQMSDYRVTFSHIYDLMSAGAIRTTQAANAEMEPYKEPVHDAERTLATISDYARKPGAGLDPAMLAQRVGFAISALLFVILAFLLVRCLRSLPPTSLG